GTAVGKPLVHRGPVLAVALDRDGKHALTGSADGTAGLWRAADGEPIREPLVHPDAVTAVAFVGPRDETVLTVCKDGAVRLWAAAAAGARAPPLAHGGEVRCWALAPGGRSLLTGADRTARHWHVPAELRGEAGHVRLWVEVLTRLHLDGEVPRDLDDEAW